MFPFDSPLELTYIAVAIFVAIAVVILYKFVLEPKVQYPLQNEQDEGIWRLPLPQLGRVNEGRVVTARRYLQGLWAATIEAAEDDKRPGLIAERDSEMNYHWFAQKCGGKNILYCFDLNPLEPQFHMREDREGRFGGETAVRFVYGVKDSVERKEHDGFTVIGVKLTPEEAKLTQDERKNYDLRHEGVSYLRLAAENLGKIKFLAERLKSLDDLLHDERKKHAETRSKLDRALSALEQKTLSTTGEAKVPGGFVQKVKEWFTWPQLITAAVAYFSSGPIIQWLSSSQGLVIQPPITTYVTLMITIAGFFIIPVVKKVFGRWL